MLPVIHTAFDDAFSEILCTSGCTAFMSITLSTPNIRLLYSDILPPKKLKSQSL